MKALLTAVNSKYIHSNLAVYNLKKYAEEVASADIEIAEYTINQPINKIMMDIYKKQPDVVFFSCYIWNREEIKQLVQNLSKVRPELDIWLGGPEVSYNAEDTLADMTGAKGVLKGEGEAVFAEVVKAYTENPSDERLAAIEHIAYRNDKGEVINTARDTQLDIDSVPFAYDNLDEFQNRIIYYESSRGCPFRCSYCISSIDKSLRFRNLDKVKSELKFFIDRNVKQVKFIDRTFNCNDGHAQEIWKFIKDNDNGITNFHFEIAADIISESCMELLESMRPGQVQLEIGVQSTNPETLKEIRRPMDFAKVAETVNRIKGFDNTHLHLDLIAGLPYEDIMSFENSFNEVFALRPEALQLGFLKVLKGTYMEEMSEEYGLKCTDAPPYEVLRTKWLSYEEIIRLKMIEEMLEVYYNSGQFVTSVELLLTAFLSPFKLFEALAVWYQDEGQDMINLSRNCRYENLLKFGREYVSEKELLECLVYDYYARENVKTRPEFFGEETVEKEYAKEFYNREAENHAVLTSPECMSADMRTLRRLTHIEKIKDVYYLFDYTQRSPMTGNAKIVKL